MEHPSLTPDVVAARAPWQTWRVTLATETSGGGADGSVSLAVHSYRLEPQLAVVLKPWLDPIAPLNPVHPSCSSRNEDVLGKTKGSNCQEPSSMPLRTPSCESRKV